MMKLLLVLLALVALYCVHIVLGQSQDEIDDCNFKFAPGTENDADSVYYMYDRPGEAGRIAIPMACNIFMRWNQISCDCLPTAEYLAIIISRRDRPCDLFMGNAYIADNNVALGSYGNKAIAFNNDNGIDITKDGGQMCFANGATAGVYYTVDNDLGRRFTINMVVTISGLGQQDADTVPIVILSNGGCTIGQTLQQATLTVTYQQSTDTYSVFLSGRTASCRPLVYNGQNNARQARSILTASRIDRLQIDAFNNRLTLSVNGDVLATSTIGTCSITPTGGISRDRNGNVPGTRCRLSFGDIGGTGYSICFTELAMGRDCSTLDTQ